MASKFDLAVWNVLAEKTEPAEMFSTVSGEKKLVQRFLIELFTPRGSIPFAPQRGTSLMHNWRRGTVSPVVAHQIFSIAVSEAGSNLMAEETESHPLNERFGGVGIDSVDILFDRIKARLVIYSRAGAMSVAVQISIP